MGGRKQQRRSGRRLYRGVDLVSRLPDRADGYWRHRCAFIALGKCTDDADELYQKRRIGSIKTDASSNILPFSQNGDEFLWSVPINEWNGTAIPTTPTLFTLAGSPAGVKVNAMLRIAVEGAPNGAVNVIFQSPDEASAVANTPVGNNDALGEVIPSSGSVQIFMPIVISRRTNVSAQLRWSSFNAGNVCYGVTYGWIDTRGRFN